MAMAASLEAVASRLSWTCLASPCLEICSPAAVLKNTEDNTKHHVTSAWLAGADGGHSPTRKILDIDLPGHTWP